MERIVMLSALQRRELPPELTGMAVGANPNPNPNPTLTPNPNPKP